MHTFILKDILLLFLNNTFTSQSPRNSDEYIRGSYHYKIWGILEEVKDKIWDN